MSELTEKFEQGISHVCHDYWNTSTPVAKGMFSLVVNHEGHQYALKIVQLDAELPRILTDPTLSIVENVRNAKRVIWDAGFKKVVEE